MKDLVVSTSAGVICPGPNGSPNVYFGIPSKDPIEKLIKGKDVRAVLMNAMISSERTGESLTRSLFPSAGGNPEYEILLLQIPRLFEDDSRKSLPFIYIVDRMVRNFPAHELELFYIEPLKSIVAAWVSHIVRVTTSLRWNCRQLQARDGGRQDPGERQSLESHLIQLQRMLPLPDLVRAIECLQSHDADGLPVMPTAVTEALGEDFSKWRRCVPPSWPPTCEGCDNGNGANGELVRWSQWRNVSPSQLDRDREKALDEVEVLLKQLPRRASEMLSPKTNVLPHGLKCFVLGRGTEAWMSQRLAFWRSGAASSEEVANAVRCVARVAHYVLGTMPLDEKTFDAMVWLLCEYAHHALGVPGQIDLRAHLMQSARGEPALHVLRRFYRDHFFHVLEVCFLGHFLLELKVNPTQRLWHCVAAQLGLGTRPNDKQAILRLWYVAALLHDVGYGIDVLKGVHSLLGFFRNAKPLGNLTGRLAKALDDLSTDLQAEGLALYTAKDKPGEDHGVVAAWHLQRLLQRAAEKDTDLQWLEYTPAIRAIALHNSRKHTVRFADDPLAFLLVLCDTLQEWNRPCLGFSTGPSYLLSQLLERQADADPLDRPLAAVGVNVSELKSDSTYRMERYSRPLRFALVFNESISRNAGVFNLWIDATCNLQRLDFEGLPDKFDVEIEYHTPLFRSEPGDPFEQQLYRLRDAASETHMIFLDRWFPKCQQRVGKKMAITNGAVTWRPGETASDIPDLEMLRFHLRKLSETKPINGSMEQFRNKLARWRRYNDDRDFGGDYGVPESVD